MRDPLASAGAAAVAVAAGVALLAAAPAARAESSVSANGYGAFRTDYTVPRLDVPLAAIAEQPEWRFLLELNGQLRLTYTEGWDLYADVSLFHSNFVGEETPATDALRRNIVLVNELYQNLAFHEHLTGLVGKKRVIWGTGFAWNPADLLNLGKDPTDPALQRVGAWLVSLEVPFAKWTVTALFAPQVLATEAGLPSRLLVDEEGDAHWIAGARAYALLFDSDVMLMYWLGDRWADDRRHRSHLGASFARYFFTDYELHFEVLAHLGSTRSAPNPDCVSEGPDRLLVLAGCALADPPVVFTRPDVESNKPFVRFIVGTRYTFPDSSILNFEYYYNGEGLRRDEFRDRVSIIETAAEAATLGNGGGPAGGFDPAVLLGGGGGEAGTPARLSFDPARRHYLFISYVKPQIRDDFTWMITLIAGLEDPSAIVATSLTWTAKEWLQLGAYAFVPFGAEDSELGALPQWARLSLEARAFY